FRREMLRKVQHRRQTSGHCWRDGARLLIDLRSTRHHVESSGRRTPRNRQSRFTPAVQVTLSAQFIAVCSSAKPCKIGENLLSVFHPISCAEERLIHAGVLVPPSTLQHRTMSSLHPYPAMERSAPPMSPVPESGRRSVGELSLPTWM